MRWVTANDLAGEEVGDQKSFRNALRADLRCQIWHMRHQRWKVLEGSKEHEDLKLVFVRWKEQ